LEAGAVRAARCASTTTPSSRGREVGDGASRGAPWSASSRHAIWVEGGPTQVSCLCSVDGRLAGFQVDSGSTFSQIVPELAPENVPRLGLGSANCLGRRVWFPTCDVFLAPVDQEGHVLDFEGSLAFQATLAKSRVQIGPVNLLGLMELQRWQVQLTFGPGVCNSSVLLGASAEETTRSFGDGHETMPLREVLRAAEVLNSGTVVAEEAVSEANPQRVDAARVLELSRAKALVSLWPTTGVGSSSPLRESAEALEVASALQPVVPPSRRQEGRPPGHKVGSGHFAHMDHAEMKVVLFGTADALLSDTMLPPLLPPPLLEWPEVFFGTADALVSEKMPSPLLPSP